jgi:hypothetical protein
MAMAQSGKVQMELHTPKMFSEPQTLKHRLIEFVMLFAAVTLGFFAENQREHYLEAQREHDFILDIRRDVVFELGEMKKLMNTQARRAKEYERLAKIDRSNWESNIPYLYYADVLFSLKLNWSPTQETYKSMLATGALRYFRDQKFVAMLKEYEMLLDRFEARRERFLLFMYNYYDPIWIEHFRLEIDKVPMEKRTDMISAMTGRPDFVDVKNEYAAFQTLRNQKSFDIEKYKEVVGRAILLEQNDRVFLLEDFVDKSNELIAYIDANYASEKRLTN